MYLRVSVGDLAHQVSENKIKTNIKFLLKAVPSKFWRNGVAEKKFTLTDLKTFVNKKRKHNYKSKR